MFSVKNKIRLGTIFLFLLVVSSGTFSIYYLMKLKEQSKNILKANYETIQYCHQMQKSLDSILDGKRSLIDSFENELQHQEKNITEAGETTATESLRLAFNKLKTGDVTKTNADEISFHCRSGRRMGSGRRSERRFLCVHSRQRPVQVAGHVGRGRER